MFPKVIRVFYNRLSCNPNLLLEKVSIFNILLGTNFKITEYVRLIHRIKDYTINVKLRSFQYQLLLGVIITNVNLKHFKIRQDNLCSFCEGAPEKLVHLFYDCTEIRALWRKVEDLIGSSLDSTRIFTNVIRDNPRLVESCIVLFVKYYIYISRCRNERILWTSCKNYLLMYRNIERQIALDRNKINLHNAKWNAIVL